MEKFIELKAVTKEFRSGATTVHALQGVSLAIARGEFVSILGPSGSGKSTLLHAIGGLEPLTCGKVYFKGEDLYAMSDKKLSFWRNRVIGFVFQFYHLIEELNILENISISAYRSRRKSTLKRARELLKYLGIEGHESFFPSQLSGGQKQKVALARALINEPELILCDEPTGNLDRKSQDKVISLLQKLNKEMNKTVIMVTHNLELAQECDRVLFIDDGIMKT